MRAGLAVVVFAVSCGGEPRVPTGEPLTVVRAAPDLTIAAGTITVIVESPRQNLQDSVDLGREDGPSAVRRRALEALDVARSASEAVPYGGQQVRGASTMRYEIETEDGAEADIWIDVEGRARRVQLVDGPLDASPPPTQPNGLPALVTIDFVLPEPA